MWQSRIKGSYCSAAEMPWPTNPVLQMYEDMLVQYRRQQTWAPHEFSENTNFQSEMVVLIHTVVVVNYVANAVGYLLCGLDVK